MLDRGARRRGFPSPASAYLKLGTRVGTRTVTAEVVPDADPVLRHRPRNGGRDLPRSFSRPARPVVQLMGSRPRAPACRPNSPVLPSANPSRGDGATALGFQHRPDLERTLGATSFMEDTTTGAILEADIFFNTAFPWSVASQGRPNTYDLESIALHEIGHLHGLAHSALGETELNSSGRRVIARRGGDVSDRVLFPATSRAGRERPTTSPASATSIRHRSSPRDTGSISGQE